MEDKYICCICGKEHAGFGNNPNGAVDENKKLLVWAEDDRCCDECNSRYVLPGRMYRFYKVIKTESLVKKQDN